MDAVILAGGRGHRMGALTHRRQKGTLLVNGSSILAHVLIVGLCNISFQRGSFGT